MLQFSSQTSRVVEPYTRYAPKFSLDTSPGLSVVFLFAWQRFSRLSASVSYTATDAGKFIGTVLRRDTEGPRLLEYPTWVKVQRSMISSQRRVHTPVNDLLTSWYNRSSNDESGCDKDVVSSVSSVSSVSLVLRSCMVNFTLMLQPVSRSRGF